MKQSILILCILISTYSCSKEKKCPKEIFINSYDVETESLKWNPYKNYSEVIFTDLEGDEFIFDIQNEFNENRQLEIIKGCENDSDKFVTYNYQANTISNLLELKSGNIGVHNFGPISVKIIPFLHEQNPEDELVGDFISISHLTSPYSYSIGNCMEFVVNQKSFPTVENNVVQFLEEHISNGVNYKNVVTNRHVEFNNEDVILTPMREIIFGNLRLYYNNEIGIIEMELVSGKKLFYKEFR